MSKDYLQLKKSNCKNCYKCIRHCPVKSIRFSDNQANILEEDCIQCGQCFVNCPQNAKEIRKDTGRAKELLASPRPVYASIAPSFVANYEGVNIQTMEKALKKLGFKGVEETAIGATIVKKQYDQMILENQQDVIISSCCHSVNTLIQKYYPEALKYLAHVLSPMQAHCVKIKKEHPDAYTVFIGPCISKKAEADQYEGIVDCVLTFEELTEWLKDENVSFDPVHEDEKIGRARLFPTPGGIIRSMDCSRKDYSYITIDGTENCIHALEDIISGKISKCFIEMSACSGSCIGGPAMDKAHRITVSDYLAVNHYAGEIDFPVIMPNEKELSKEISYQNRQVQMPGNDAINEILLLMGKPTAEQELNCGSCGYNTCRDKAIAVYLGKADLTMCLPHLKEKAESFSDNIINNTPNGIMVLNEDLEIQQINAAACRMMNIKSTHDILTKPIVDILDPIEYITVLQSGKGSYDKQIYLPQYKKYIKETIIHDKNYHIIISIMR
ncbi:MAG: 4Fe-4S binding protein, partial [Clostridiales bacterium]|nr:4Fe-4S binding protein [Clostridiales bacterium]